MSAPATARPAAAPAATATATTAVVFATARGETGAPAGAMEWDAEGTLVDRLGGQLRSLGIEDIRLVVRPGHRMTVAGTTLVESDDAAADLRLVAALAGEGSGPLVFAGAEIIPQREALAGLLADPRVNTGILTTSGKIARPYGYRTKT